MQKLTKFIGIMLIITFLASIPLSVIAIEPEIVIVVDKIEVETFAGKPSGTPGGKPTKPGSSDGGKPGAYVLNGFKWYTLDLTLYVSQDNMLSFIEASVAEWDMYTGANLVSDVVLDTDAYFADELLSRESDGRNELVFADLDLGTIAVCYTWYLGDSILQFDIAFNTDYTWGDATVDSGVMDFQNIATHELGHGFGLGDMYKRNLSYLTMYGYSGEGDTAKRTLAQGDIDGIQALYGA